MDIRQLRYFLAVVEHKHFTRAAEANYVSQPALSQQIQALERELGAPLFDRLPRRIELTAAGRALRGYAERAVREVENGRVAVEEVLGTVRGELSVSMVQTAGIAVVVEAVARFRTARPEVFVRVHEEASAQVVGSVVNGKVNLGITYLPAGDGSLRERSLYEEELLLVLPVGHDLVGRTCSLGTVGDLPLIIPPGGYCLRDGIDRALSASAVPARIVAEISAVESILGAVRAGLGVTILPAPFTQRSEGMGGLATARINPVPRRTVGLIRHADRHLCLASRSFLETLDEVCRQRSESGWFRGAESRVAVV